MKIFSSLLAFVMMFACLSVAYADVPVPPRPDINRDPFVRADINKRGKLTLEIEFFSDWNYKYWLVDKNTGEKISSHDTKGLPRPPHGTSSFHDSVNLRDRLSDGENYFLLTIEIYDIETQTRFGIKKRRDNITWTKTIVVEKNSADNSYSVRVYDGKRD